MLSQIVFKKKKKKLKKKNPPSHPLHYLDLAIGMGCHLLIYFCFFVAVLITSNSMFLIFYVIYNVQYLICS